MVNGDDVTAHSSSSIAAAAVAGTAWLVQTATPSASFQHQGRLGDGHSVSTGAVVAVVVVEMVLIRCGVHCWS